MFLKLIRRVIVTILVIAAFLGFSNPAMAYYDRVSLEVDSSCIGWGKSVVIEVTQEDQAWLNEYLTAGEVEYVVNNGLTTSMLNCFLERKAASKEFELLPTFPTLDMKSIAGGAVERWRPLVKAYFPENRVSWAMRIMRCESGGNPYAKNKYSSAAGLFQFLRKTWNDAADALGLPDYDSGGVYNPLLNIRAAAWLLAEHGPDRWSCNK
jgi:hypothetical protein